MMVVLCIVFLAIVLPVVVWRAALVGNCKAATAPGASLAGWG
jgi:hypothetical protein